MKDFGIFTAFSENMTDDETGITHNVIIFRDAEGVDWLGHAAEFPHPFFIAIDGDSKVISMENDASSSQIAGYRLIGIDSDFGFTRGSGGSVYGKTWDGSAIVAPVIDPREQMPVLTPRQFRDTLIDNDIMPDDVTAAISQIEDPKQRAKALNAWEYPTQFTRTDPLIDQIGAMFGLSPEAIDLMWAAAAGAAQ